VSRSRMYSCSCSCCGEAGHSAVAAEVAFKLGKRAEEMGHEPASPVVVSMFSVSDRNPTFRSASTVTVSIT
jgi:hypothetical protein